jgi:hypothetical protein
MPYPMPIERGKIREFARATGSSAAEYLENPNPPVPLTFLRTSTFWEPPGSVSPLSGLKLNLSRILHGEQEYEFFGPPPSAGSELTVASHLESVTEKEGRRGGTMRFITVVQDFTDASGKLVARGRSTLIETARAPE